MDLGGPKEICVTWDTHRGVYAGIRHIPTSRLFCWHILTPVAIYEQGICGLYAVQRGIALSPSKKAKYVSYSTKINTITSQQMVFFQARNALKTVFGRGFIPDPTAGAHDAPPDSLVGWGGGTPPHFPPLSGQTATATRSQTTVNVFV